MVNRFFERNLTSVRDLTRADFELLFNVTDKIISHHATYDVCRGKTLGCIFFEPSTRTRLSFESAMLHLGGNTIEISSILSSTQKGESLGDTIKIISLYSDILVLRHPLDGSSKFAAEMSTKPIINGGSGTEEHPTQTIQDLYTMKKEMKKIDGLKIAIVGDLKYGRTVYSLLYGLSNYDVTIYLISPESLKIRTDSIYEIKKKLQILESTRLDDHLDDLDVIYVTRIQKERFQDKEEYFKVKGSYTIDKNVVKKMKRKSIILHPLPRLDEIPHNVDRSIHAKYFKQAEYGKYTRAALLGLIINNGFVNDISS
ncbi:MAG: aspartate carbamoyltransferase [Thaumarchaeota archaeon]|nr:aspartate carbamoyltransferase [Nitrososphaerota archaeon]MCY3975793.1 aspartate carbamoyltransferase [Nitrososphaerota archaeon]